MKFLKGLTLKMSYGYIAIVAVAILVFVVLIGILNQNRRADAKISKVIVPTLILFKDANMLNSEAKRLNNSWIYTPTPADKARLKHILTEDFRQMLDRIRQTISNAAGDVYFENIQSLQKLMEAVKQKSEELMGSLANDEDYGDDAKVDAALTLYEKELMPLLTQAEKIVTETTEALNQNMEELLKNKEATFDMLFYAFLLMVAFILGAGIFSLMVSHRIIIKPINRLKEIIQALALGEILPLSKTKAIDEIGEMNNNITDMITGFKIKTEFAIEIGKGNYTKEFKPLSDHDTLGNALLDMRKNLQANSEDEGRRNWATSGLAQLGDILRKTDSSLADMCNDIIRFVVQYTKSNQGGIFILERNNKGDEFLELKACYAYERRKYIEKKIELGEGLVGQCFVEREVIYMTSVPDNYLKITSGLGQANPRALILVPLKLTDSIFGVFEVASFYPFEKYQQDFFSKIAESIASAINSVKINERTKLLLNESQEQSERLRTQEEEMRQNLEEMQATQEEMNRKEQEYVRRIAELESFQIVR